MTLEQLKLIESARASELKAHAMELLEYMLLHEVEIWNDKWRLIESGQLYTTDELYNLFNPKV